MASKLHTSFGNEQNMFFTISLMQELIEEGLPILADPVRVGISNLAISLYIKNVSNPPERRDS